MKASRAIEMLKDYDPDQELYVLWWDSNIDEDGEDTPILSSTEWAGIVKTLERWGEGSEEVNETIDNEVSIVVSQRTDGMTK